MKRRIQQAQDRKNQLEDDAREWVKRSDEELERILRGQDEKINKIQSELAEAAAKLDIRKRERLREKQSRKASLTIQRIRRGCVGRRQAGAIRQCRDEQNAVLCIQSAIRRWLDREILLEILRSHAAWELQCEGNLDWDIEKEVAAIRIQCFY